MRHFQRLDSTFGSKRFRWVDFRGIRRLSTIGLLFIFSIFVHANPIKVLPDNATIQIKGRVGDEGSFIQRVILISDQVLPEVIFLSEDIKTQGDKARIARQQIGLASGGKLSLAANTPANVDIKITGVKLPGTYSGQIYFLIPGKAMEDKLAIQIEGNR